MILSTLCRATLKSQEQFNGTGVTNFITHYCVGGADHAIRVPTGWYRGPATSRTAEPQQCLSSGSKIRRGYSGELEVSTFDAGRLSQSNHAIKHSSKPIMSTHLLQQIILGRSIQCYTAQICIILPIIYPFCLVWLDFQYRA